jgi:hypothetical protein
MKKAFLMNTFLIIVSMVMLLTMNVFAATTSTGSYTTGQSIAVSLVNQNPDPAAAGDTVEVRLGIENFGNADVQDMIVEVVPSYPFEAVSGEAITQDIGSVNSYQSGDDVKIVKFTVLVNKNAAAGTYDLDVKYYNKGDEANSVTKTVNITVNTKSSVEIIHIDKTVLVPGQQSGLTFVVNNVGGSALRDLKFYWSNGDNVVLPVGSDNTRYIKSLDVGGSVELTYQVIADTSVTAGLYPLNLYLTYTDSSTSTETTVSTIAGVYIGGGTDFDVAFSAKSSSEISFSIANIGSNPATSVSIVVPDQSGWTVSGSNSVIIGNLNTGDYTVASFTLQQSTTGSGAAAMPSRNGSTGTRPADMTGTASTNRSIVSSDTVLMQIAYTDTMGNRNIVNKTVKLGSQNVASGMSSNSTSSGFNGGPRQSRGSTVSSSVWYILGAIILVVVGIIFYSRYRHKKLLGTDAGAAKELFKSKKK